MRVTLFTDLNCPFCYATELRLERLGVVDEIAWRGVEHEPDLPVPDGARRRSRSPPSWPRRSSRSAVAGAGGRHRACRPGSRTRPGLLATAAALRADAAAGAAFRRSVYAAFWRDGRDISDAAVLDELAQAVGLRAAATAAGGRGDRRLRGSSNGSARRCAACRSSSATDGETVYGLKDLETLERFLR